jgi:hypothetical protein
LFYVFTRILATTLRIVFGHSALAGPWLREKGETFTAVSVTSTYTLDTTSQTYLEYGLTAKTTLIGDIALSRLHTGAEAGAVTASLKRALSPPDAATKWAYELGVGVSWNDMMRKPHLRSALSWGKGINWREKTDWATVEAATIWDLGAKQHVAKMDATLGLNLTPVTSAMVQVFTAFSQDYRTTKISPSILLAPKDSAFSIQIGMESTMGDFESSAIKFGLWRKF